VNLAPHILVNNSHLWQDCLEKLRDAPRLALDLEANNMYAYQERVCLIQVTAGDQDFIIDPLSNLDLSGLGELLEDARVEKVFHAAEYDLILLKREYGWGLNNLFDTMWAARILGYPRYGLASLLEELFQVKLNKRYQKSNWCQRPLSPPQLAYARLDTHYLLPLRDYLGEELRQAGREEEACEIFTEQARVKINDHTFSPDSFWSVHGVHELTERQQAILREVNIYRDKEARKRNRPLFKVFNNRTLIELAQVAPKTLTELRQVYGMTPGQIRRYGRPLLAAIEAGRKTPLPLPRKRNKRPPEAVLNRYEKLHNWRKRRARKRGVESDVIISRDALWVIAETNPRTEEELSKLCGVGRWRCQTYGQEILDILREM